MNTASTGPAHLKLCASPRAPPHQPALPQPRSQTDQRLVRSFPTSSSSGGGWGAVARSVGQPCARVRRPPPKAQGPQFPRARRETFSSQRLAVLVQRRFRPGVPTCTSLGLGVGVRGRGCHCGNEVPQWACMPCPRVRRTAPRARSRGVSRFRGKWALQRHEADAPQGARLATVFQEVPSARIRTEGSAPRPCRG